jgi:molecular chaperone DnaK (HSP70)
MVTDSSFSIGIDLGTTNTALAFVEHTSAPQGCAVLSIPQLIDSTLLDKLPTLPSFLYQAPSSEQDEILGKLHWETENAFLVGTVARQLGEKTPQRLISSAKSWLCQAEGQRHPILPLYAPEDVSKISAVAASAAYLRHLREVWDEAHIHEKLADQQITLTVPASFDAVARELTLQAAHDAGLQQVTLLEEPISAFYAWLGENGEQWREQVDIGDLILVCDIGGGTTDFSLILVEQSEGSLSLTRVAVGEHILLGGDNMDLALARMLQLKLEAEGKKLQQWQFFGLAHSCRKAKEQLLGDASLAQVSVVVPSRGSKLVGKTLSIDLTRDDLEMTLLDGFFSPSEITDRPTEPSQRTGFRTLGLNYAQDSRILRHLAKFLSDSRQRLAPDSILRETFAAHDFLAPSAILFNGGSTKAPAFQERIVSALDGWLTAHEFPKLKHLRLNDQDLAVAQGAAYYGSVQRGEGLRIRSTTPFAYYVGIESTMPAIPGMPPFLNGLCVAPAGMEEGSTIHLPEAELGLLIGETAQFRFFISRDRQDEAGTIVENIEDELEELASLEVCLDLEEGEEARVVPIQLEARLTEVGALEVWCTEASSSRRWKLEFNLRED